MTNSTVTINKAGAGTGAVRSNPDGIDCRATCNGKFPLGSTIHLTAVPDPGSIFAGWSGDCSGTGPCLISPNATVTATFNIASPPAESGGGGCTVAPSAAGDMMLPTMFLMSLIVLLWRTSRP
ncbi:MAG: JDVT-CTERM domain-containing protein [Nitrospira sp.]|nr:JDVT-CTERM domain-containing protein [Nitrospira sp.]